MIQPKKKVLEDIKQMSLSDATEALANLEKLKTLREGELLREKRDRRLRRIYRSFLTTAKNHKTSIDEILAVGRRDIP